MCFCTERMYTNEMTGAKVFHLCYERGKDPVGLGGQGYLVQGSSFGGAELTPYGSRLCFHAPYTACCEVDHPGHV